MCIAKLTKINGSRRRCENEEKRSDKIKKKTAKTHRRRRRFSACPHRDDVPTVNVMSICSVAFLSVTEMNDYSLYLLIFFFSLENRMICSMRARSFTSFCRRFVIKNKLSGKIKNKKKTRQMHRVIKGIRVDK